MFIHPSLLCVFAILPLLHLVEYVPISRMIQGQKVVNLRAGVMDLDGVEEVMDGLSAGHFEV